MAELLTTVAVIGITASVAVPGYQTIVNGNRKAASVNSLVSTLHAARSEAITRNAQVTVCPSTDGEQCGAAGWNNGWIAFVDTDRSRAVNAGETILAFRDASASVGISTAEFGDFLAYRPNGRIMVNDVDDNTGDFTFCDHRGAAHARVISINFSGQVSVSGHMGNGAPAVCP